MIFGKPLKDVDEQDIQRLVDDEIEENINLDYKKEIDLSSKGKKELSKDVSAFANSRGGVIIYGIEEKENALGIPVPVSPIAGIDSGVDREQIENIILNSIKPELHIELRRIQLSSDSSRCVFVISIPQSLHAPHMVTKDKDNRYYKRCNYSSVLMEEYEVRDLFEQNAQMREKVSEIKKSKDNGLRDPNNDEYPWICMLSIPEIVIDNLFKVDAENRDWLNRVLFRKSFWHYVDGVVPCSSGFRCKFEENQDIVFSGKSQKTRYLIEIGKNGVIEWGSNVHFDLEHTATFLTPKFAPELIDFLQLTGKFYEKVNYFGSVEFVLGFNNVYGCRAQTPLDYISKVPPIFKERHLLISRNFLASQLTENCSSLAHDIMNEFSNAFGLMKCPFFDSNDNLII